MVDFSKIFNIVFVSACAALLLFLLISAIVVAAKGKRKCGAFDVILRILSSLVLIVSAAMVACSVLTMLNTIDGSTCIVVAQEGNVAAAWLAIGGEIIELPLPELFVALSTVIGFGLSAVLFILSLTALIVDCLVANKKSDKAKKSDKKSEPKKTPEQLKREAEIERIRRIGASAVQKTNSVATASEKPAAEQPQEPESDVDWRTEPQEQKPAEFVGIKDADEGFDSFDSFDDTDSVEPEQPEQDDDTFDEVEQPEQEVDTLDEVEQPEQEDDTLDEVEQAEQEVDTLDEVEQPEQEDNTFDEVEQPEQEDDTFDEVEQPEQEVEEPDYEDMSAWQFDAENGGEAVGDEEDNVEPEPEPVVAPKAKESEPDDGIEPYRGIYIPKIRTITRGDSKPAAPAKPQQPKRKPAGSKPATEKKPVASKPAADKKPATAAKPKRKPAAQQKPAAKKTDGAKTQKPAENNIPPEKKLPVTRRYVILDRHSAVNMFGEYLKERSKADTDKLKSSISTIIIE